MARSALTSGSVVLVMHAVFLVPSGCVCVCVCVHVVKMVEIEIKS